VEPIPVSGLHYPNKIARIYLQAMEEVMGKNGVNAILNMANLTHLIDHYPPDNLNREFDFAHYSSLNGALEEIYGPRGGRGLALRAGRASFAQGLRTFGALAGAGDLAFKVLPLGTKLKIGIPAMAKIFTALSDRRSVVEDRGTEYVYIMKPCPVCWGRRSEKPMCHAGAGLLAEGLRWLSGGHEFRVVETECVACGGDACVLTVPKQPLS
jgi:hypothetical protein